MRLVALSSISIELPDRHPSDMQEPDRNAPCESLRKALKGLSPRERNVLQLRFGLKPRGRSRTLKEIGARLKLSAERVRQIELKAIMALRANPSLSFHVTRIETL